MIRPANSRGRAMLRGVAVGLLALFALALVGLQVSPSAQAAGAPLCTRFGAETAGLSGWGACTAAPNIVVTTSNTLNMSGDPADYYLHLRDTAGPSAACSTDEQYLGDWNQKMGGCGSFCFDFKVFKSGTPPGPITPSFSIWSGPLRATFVANFTVTTDDPWVHICAPVNLIDPGQNLPFGASGAWHIAPTANAYSADWNTIITNVTMVQLPIDFTSDPSEEVGYDNLCMNPEDCKTPPPLPKVTGCLKDSKVEVICNGDGTYTLTLDGTTFPGTDITLASETPGVTVTPPQQPWAASSSWTIVGAAPGETVTLMATTTQVGGGSATGTDLCCAGEITIVMPECPPLPEIDISIDKEVKPLGGPDNKFDLVVTNVGAPITFGPGEITVADTIPAGMTVYSLNAPDWTCGPPIPSTGLAGPVTLICTYNLAGSAGTNVQIGSVISIDATSDKPGILANCATVKAAAGVGIETDLDNNKDCAEVIWQPHEMIDLGIEKTGGTTPYPQSPNYGFHLTVTNHGSAFNGNGAITISDVVPAGMTFDSATGIDWLCNAPPPLSAGQMLTCTYQGTAVVNPGAILGTIDIVATATGMPPFPPFLQCATVDVTPSSGLADSNPENDTDCITVSKPKTKSIDLALRKDGMAEPDPVGTAVTFQLYVSSPGAPFVGANVAQIVDAIPAGVTITAAAGTDWTCLPLPITGPADLTCTYIGAGPTTSGQSLGVITLTGRGTGDGPFEQCAAVGVVSASSVQDTNAANDQSCVTVSAVPPVAPACDPNTTKLTGNSCACKFPRMTKTSSTMCMCVAGSKLVAGKGCVAQISCKAPLVPNNAGTACVCAGDLVLRKGKCVEQPSQLKCPVNMIPNKAGTACMCLPGLTETAKGCALPQPKSEPRPKPEPRPEPRQTPNTVIPDNSKGIQLPNIGTLKLPGR